MRLVCLPHAGGASSYFHPVSATLAPAVEVLAVQYPGRQERLREPCVDTVAGLADAVAAELALYGGSDERDLALFGHSLGGSVGFELARRLEASGRPVAALFASGRRSPTAPRDEHDHLLDDEAFLAVIKRLGGSDPRVFEDVEIRELVMPALRGDYKAAENYRYTPGPPLACPVHVMVGTEDDRVTGPEAAAWAEVTEGGMTLHRFPGGHFYLNEQVPRVLDVIRRALGVGAFPG